MSPLLSRHHCSGFFLFKNLELDSGFRRSDEHWGAWFFVVIPAEAGIQDHEKIKPCPVYYGLISNCLHPPFRKGGRGGFESWENPPESPFARGGLLRQVKLGKREKVNKKDANHFMLPLINNKKSGNVFPLFPIIFLFFPRIFYKKRWIFHFKILEYITNTRR